MPRRQPKLPRGLFYEAQRDRYRVRLYYRREILWHTYHSERAEAFQTLADAQKFRLEQARSLAKDPPGPLQCPSELLA